MPARETLWRMLTAASWTGQACHMLMHSIPAELHAFLNLSFASKMRLMLLETALRSMPAELHALLTVSFTSQMRLMLPASALHAADLLPSSRAARMLYASLNSMTVQPSSRAGHVQSRYSGKLKEAHAQIQVAVCNERDDPQQATLAEVSTVVFIEQEACCCCGC